MIAPESISTGTEKAHDPMKIELDSCRHAVATIEANRTYSTTQNHNLSFYKGKVAGLEFALAAMPHPVSAAQQPGMPEALAAIEAGEFTDLPPLDDSRLANSAQAEPEPMIECPVCEGSGFSGCGTGYDDVCSECGGNGHYPAVTTATAPQPASNAYPPREWVSPIKSVADLVNNLLTLDQTMDIYGAYFIDQTEDRCRARGLSLSREHVSNGRIKRDEAVPFSLVVWSALDRREEASSVSSTQREGGA